MNRSQHTLNRHRIRLTLAVGSLLILAAPGALHAAEGNHGEKGSASTVETENPEIAPLFGELLALSPRLNELSLSEDEKNAIADGLLEGLTAETIPPEVKDRYQDARESMQAQFMALTNRTEPLPSIGPEMGRIIGIMTAEFGGVSGFDFSGEELDLIREGFLQGMDQESMSPELLADINDLFAYLDKKMASYEATLGEKISSRERAFFENLREEEPEVEYDEEGLHWKIIDEGVGDPPNPEDTVLVHYEGSRTNGDVFDSSYERESPAEFSMSGVIPGFSMGLRKIGKGGKVIIYIPAELGYGANPPPGSEIQPGDTLIFDAEIIDIERAESAEGNAENPESVEDSEAAP